MTEARRHRLTTLLLVAAVLTAGLVGAVDATEQVDSQQLTTGHSEFVDASSTFSSCFAGLAGAVLQRVTWFNGATLFSRMNSDGDDHIYVTEHLTDDGPPDGFNESTGFRTNVDPSQQQLYRTDKTYKFQDENDPDKTWIVREFFELRDRKETKVEGPQPGDGDDQPVVSKEKFYVFVVQVSDHAIEDPTLGRDYNFALVVDTCRFKAGPTDNATHEDGQEGTTGAPAGQHDSASGDNGTHDHGRFSVDIWVGDDPNTPAGGAAQVPDDRGNESTRNDTRDGQP